MSSKTNISVKLEVCIPKKTGTGVQWKSILNGGCQPVRHGIRRATVVGTGLGPVPCLAAGDVAAAAAVVVAWVAGRPSAGAGRRHPSPSPS